MNKIEQEKQRLDEIFTNCDLSKKATLEGLILEAARVRVELDELNDIADRTGIFYLKPDGKPYMQKALPVLSELTKVRASYTHIIDRLARHLNVEHEDIDDSLDGFV